MTASLCQHFCVRVESTKGGSPERTLVVVRMEEGGQEQIPESSATEQRVTQLPDNLNTLRDAPQRIV